MALHPSSTLVRAIGRWSLTAAIVNGVVGSSIFVMPATITGMVGAASPIAVLVAGAAIFIVVLCFAEVGSRFADAGGPYTVEEGGSITLSGSGADPTGQPIVSYEWDFNYNGLTFTPDATGEAASFSAAGSQRRWGALCCTINKNGFVESRLSRSQSSASSVVMSVTYPGTARLPSAEMKSGR